MVKFVVLKGFTAIIWKAGVLGYVKCCGSYRVIGAYHWLRSPRHTSQGFENLPTQDLAVFTGEKKGGVLLSHSSFQGMTQVGGTAIRPAKVVYLVENANEFH